MKTAVSIPDDVFEKAEVLARRCRISRSALYTTALKIYVTEHMYSEVTNRLNDVYSEDSASLEPDLQLHARKVLSNEKW